MQLYTNQLAPEHTRMAMAVTGQNRHYEWVRILRRHWISAARTCGIFQEVAQAIIVELVENTPAVITKVSAVLRSTFPVDVANNIFNGMRASTFKLAGAS